MAEVIDQIINFFESFLRVYTPTRVAIVNKTAAGIMALRYIDCDHLNEYITGLNNINIYENNNTFFEDIIFDIAIINTIHATVQRTPNANVYGILSLLQIDINIG